MIGPHRLPCETPEAHNASVSAAGSTRWVLPATILGSSIGLIDSSVVNVVLPAIQNSLKANLGAMQWVVNGYMLTLASLILLAGAAGDRFGRRRVFIIGLVGFAGASLACGLAPTAFWLVSARLAQGAAAALLTPSSLAIIGAAYSGEARGPAVGTWAAAGALTMSLGPPLGGWLSDMVGWRAVFFINLPIAVAALLLALKLPDDRTSEARKELDGSGAVLAVLSLGLLSYGLIALGEAATTRATIALLLSIPAAALFLVREVRAAEPMLPLSMFRSSDFSGANALTFLLYAALIGALFLLPFLLIRVHGYSAAAAGAAFFPFSVIMGLGSRWSGGLVDKFGPRPPLVLGPAVAAIGFATLGLSGASSSYWSGFLPGLIVVGVGMTIAVAPLTTTVLDSAPEGKSSTASGINNAAARAGGLVAVAALGLALGGTGSSEADGEALTSAYRLVMFIAAGLASVSALTAVVTIQSRVQGG